MAGGSVTNAQVDEVNAIMREAFHVEARATKADFTTQRDGRHQLIIRHARLIPPTDPTSATFYAPLKRFQGYAFLDPLRGTQHDDRIGMLAGYRPKSSCNTIISAVWEILDSLAILHPIRISSFRWTKMGTGAGSVSYVSLFLSSAPAAALLVRNLLEQHQRSNNGILATIDGRDIVFGVLQKTAASNLATLLKSYAAQSAATLADELRRTLTTATPTDVNAESALRSLDPAPLSVRSSITRANLMRWFAVFATPALAASALERNTIEVDGNAYALAAARESQRATRMGDRVRAQTLSAAREAAEYQHELRHGGMFAVNPSLQAQVQRLSRPVMPDPPAMDRDDPTPLRGRSQTPCPARSSTPQSSQQAHRSSTPASRSRPAIQQTQ